MKRTLKILLLSLVVLAVVGALFYKNGLDKSVVVLKNGSIIAADEVWESEGIFFYKYDNEVYLLSKNEVARVGKADLNFYAEFFKFKLSRFFNQTNTEFNSYRDTSPVLFDSNSPLVVIIIGITLALIIGLILIQAVFAAIKARRRESREETPAVEAPPGEVTRLDIVRYFLNLFRMQIEAEPDAPMEAIQLPEKASGSNYVYELRVNHRGEWVRRRMTIGPLGEEAGSKSKCFYVIYDAHLVVKIPAKPVTDFEQYVESIKKEGKIVDKLAPRECVIPRVSVILPLFHKFDDSDFFTPERLEERYVTWLRRNPAHQNLLKINNTFVFFMDFSRFYFLSHILENLHDVGDSIPAEIIENQELIWDPVKFRGRYGRPSEAVCFEIQAVYNQCEAGIRRLLAENGYPGTVPLFRIKKWFLTHLTGKKVSPEGSDLSEILAEKLNFLIADIFKRNEASVELYKKTIRDYVQKIRREQNKPQMAGIITNLIDLLAWLRGKRVSMRDLKPDNLLVAGDPAKYPLFLMSPEEYSLGIIDVETAVDFEKSKYKPIQQPLLGGTPFYATPSHFFDNETLRTVFHSLNKILHLQDWHAMLVMIYKVVTDELLFEQSAKLFADIKSRIRTAHIEQRPLGDVVEAASRMFWRSASLEFQLKMEGKKEALQSMNLTLSKNAATMLKKILAKRQVFLAKNMKQAVEGQTAFKNPQSRELLLQSPPARIRQLKADLENKLKSSSNGLKGASEIIKFLDHLIEIKLDYQKHVAMLKRSAEADFMISVYDLLILMFKTVTGAMLKEDWQSQPAPDEEAAEIEDEALQLEATL